ncbi:MAG TPA: Xaa-Pro peptidase family protein [Actinomycetota bacterium]|nr:Xaa-Pro peptidase family protein [Actinomycetota bacterium]
MPGVDHGTRRERLAARFSEIDVDAFLVTGLVNVRYLTGFTGTNAQLLATPDGGILFTDPRYDQQSRGEVPDLPRRIYRQDLPAAVAEACRDLGVSRLGFESGGISHRTWQRLEASSGVGLVPTEDEVERLRWTKDPDEISMLKAAQRITDEAFERVIGKLVEGITERQVGLELEVAMRQGGAERVGFDTIVAFGESAAEPHHHPTDRPLRAGDVVKLDFGCVVEGYHSDMTRTVSFGDPPAELRDVYDVVLRAHLAGIEALGPGAVTGDVDAAARTVVRDAGFGERFGHGLGHGVGLDIHEGPSLRAGNEDRIPAGAVVTVEPGIYLPGLGGVRIEDMVVVEETGPRPLPSTSKELVEVPA